MRKVSNKELHGPDVAVKIIEMKLNIPIVTWTDDVAMMERFDKVFGDDPVNRYILKKPATKANVSSLVETISKCEDYEDPFMPHNQNMDNSNNQVETPTLKIISRNPL